MPPFVRKWVSPSTRNASLQGVHHFYTKNGTTSPPGSKFVAEQLLPAEWEDEWERSSSRKVFPDGHPMYHGPFDQPRDTSKKPVGGLSHEGFIQTDLVHTFDLPGPRWVVYLWFALQTFVKVGASLHLEQQHRSRGTSPILSRDPSF